MAEKTEPYKDGYRNGYYDAKYLRGALVVSQLSCWGEYAEGYMAGQQAAREETHAN